MICGIGVDLVLVSRIHGAIDRFGERFASRIYTPDERRQSGGRAPFLAGRFAVKEALLKALGTGMAEGVRWKEIETLARDSGAPEVTCSGRVGELLGHRGIKRVWASLSHERDHAVAVVVLEGPGP
ncbi:MAG: holo-ACP synthase [Nitrospirae bacterium]|nr:holo-ACP synthase [Nitrospirota bacterium]MCL5285582.1 holo-ACP synthase [Nitrospirota bacterium]